MRRSAGIFGWRTCCCWRGYDSFERDIILWGVRWYVAYPISYRQLEEMMQERGVEVDHSSLNRWVIKYTPALDKAFRQRKRSVGTSWRLDETYIRVKGQWVRISSTGYYFRTRPFDILISLLGQRNLAP